MPNLCPSCKKPLAVNRGRRVKTKTPAARAFCRGCGLDTGWLDGSHSDAIAAAAKLAPAKPKETK